MDCVGETEPVRLTEGETVFVGETEFVRLTVGETDFVLLDVTVADQEKDARAEADGLLDTVPDTDLVLLGLVDTVPVGETLGLLD